MENSSPWFRSDSSKDERVSSKDRQNVSFKFSKLTPKALSGNKLNDDDKTREHETILSVENKEIKSSIPKEDKKLIISPIQKNIWQNTASNFRPIEGTQETSDKSINELAIEELLKDVKLVTRLFEPKELCYQSCCDFQKESAIKKAKWESREPQNITIKIPMIIQNKLPEGFETNDKLDVALRADESTLKDYENIPIEDFGVAVLRGLGCSPGDPVGNKNKHFVVPIEVSQRSKGLGLGADKKMQKVSQVKEGEDELKLVAGAYICVTHGAHKGSYGLVEGLDESRVIIKLNPLDKNISLPALYVNVISKKDFQKESKIINKDTYERYKDEHVAKNGYDSSHRSRTADENTSSCEFQDELEGSESHHFKRRHSSNLKKKHSKNRESHKHHTHHSKARHDCWVCPLLKVRFIDEKFKKGRYFNQKMVIEDIISVETCICKTEDGKYLEDIQSSMLETVIPRTDSSHIMIVKGKHKSQLGAILSRDKKECTATVQLLSDRLKVLVLDYDSICEYMGDTSLFD